MVPREEAQELDEDEYYIADLIGMEVVSRGWKQVWNLKGCYGDWCQ